MREHAQLAHNHGKHAHTGLPAHQQRVETALGARQITRKEEIQHFKHAEFQRGGYDFLNVLNGNLAALADIVGQLFDFPAQARQVAPGGESQMRRRRLRNGFPQGFEAGVCPTAKLCIRKRIKTHLRAVLLERRRQFLAAVRLSAHQKDQHARGGWVFQPLEHARGLVLLAPRFAAQQRRPVADNHHAALAHERQRLRRVDDFQGGSALQRRLVELFQARRQKRFCKRPQRFALEIFLRAGKQIDALQIARLDLRIEFLPGHGLSSWVR